METVFELAIKVIWIGEDSAAIIVDFIIHSGLQFLTVKWLHSKQNDINDIYNYLQSIVMVRKHVRKWRALFSKWRQQLNHIGFVASSRYIIKVKDQTSLR